MMLTTRSLIIIGCMLLGIILFRQEMRMDTIEEKLDDIIHVKERINYTEKDVECLAKNIYHEARGETLAGKYAVAHITINRLKTGYWGNSICKVVYAKKQFSWTFSNRLGKFEPTQWAESENIARRSLAGYRVRGLANSLFYHATYIRTPNWADIKNEAATIGNHVFYNRAKGSTLEL